MEKFHTVKTRESVFKEENIEKNGKQRFGELVPTFEFHFIIQFYQIVIL